MPIPIDKYVKINSSVIGASLFSAKDLVLRLISTNSLLPPLNANAQINYGLLQFTSAIEVGEYFGTSSEEYYRAIQYFSYNFQNGSPSAIQYSRWVETACAPMIFPLKNNNSVIGNWTTIDNGSFVLQMGGYTSTVSGLDFSAASTLSDVATIVEAGINAITGGGSVWTSASVSYSSTYGGFILTGGANDVVTNPISVSIASTGTDITGKTLLGWFPRETVVNSVLIPGAIWATGSAAQTVTDTLATTALISNNFASFDFLYNINLSESNAELAAGFAVASGGDYIYLQMVTPSNAVSWQQALADFGYTGLTLQSPNIQKVGNLTNSSVTVTGLDDTSALFMGQPVSGTHIASGTVIATISGSTSITLSIAATGSASEVLTFSAVEYPEQIPSEIAAATNYQAPKSVQNYMYKEQAGITPSVTDESTANAYDAINVNYYGVTQNTGQLVAFYQNGLLQGTINNPKDMGVAYNEVWLRSAMVAAFTNLLISSTYVPANAQGIAMITTVGISVINQALINGVISVGKTLTTAQQLAITQDSGGDTNAWRQVQTSGYWFSVVIAPSNNNPDIYVATYTLIYSKNDVIRKVVGNHYLV